MRTMKLVLAVLGVCFSMTSFAQTTSENYNVNAAENLEKQRENKFQFGGYGQIDYTQRFSSSTQYAGKLDPHRVVLFLGYQFAKNIHFVSEFEVEHGQEFYVEQAFVNYRLNDAVQFRGGVMLIPMGIINEYHEPTTFNGVNRPSLSSVIVPTTWREIGIGVHGRLHTLGLRYQAYVFNGFNGYDNGQKLNGAKGFRSGRQKALESYITSPNFSAKVDYYGIENLNIGLAGYFGKSQSKLFNNLDKEDAAARQVADSSVVNIAMLGVDARYKLGGLELRGEYIHSFIGNTAEYNAIGGKKNDLGSQMNGFYLEAAYNLLHNRFDGSKRLVPFVRYENYNTHHKTVNMEPNKALHKVEWIAGIGFQPANGIVFKVDYQRKTSQLAGGETENWLNCGIGFSF